MSLACFLTFAPYSSLMTDLSFLLLCCLTGQSGYSGLGAAIRAEGIFSMFYPRIPFQIFSILELSVLSDFFMYLSLSSSDTPATNEHRKRAGTGREREWASCFLPLGAETRMKARAAGGGQRRPRFRRGRCLCCSRKSGLLAEVSLKTEALFCLESW